jgi:bifunctional enzyme CysN/CysC
MHIVVTGHVDHGKSTIVGRLLAETGSVPAEKLETVRLACERSGKRFEHAFLLDALKDEQAQGITIDAARVFFKSRRRHYIILDAPGHEEFLKNMVTGASRAEAALLVIDAFEGLRENSRRHGFMLSMLGINQIAVLINKMDLVGYSQEVFERLVNECQSHLSQIGVTPIWFIPVSGSRGENLAAAAPSLGWYEGPTVLDALDGFTNRPRPTAAAFRMPVQAVYKFAAHGDGRIVAGTVESGRMSIGDEVVFYPSGKKSRVKTIEAFHRSPRREISAEEATGFTLTHQIYVERGEIAAMPGQVKPHVGTRMRVSLFWLGKHPLVPEKEYVLKLGTGRAPFRIERIHRVLDASNLSPKERPDRINEHEVAECTLVLRRPIAFDTVDQCPATARFVILDGFDISGGGIVREARYSRAVKKAFEPGVLWLTGLSGAGKSTIAREIYARARQAGATVEYLDGDEIRNVFPNPGFTREERDAHIRRVGFLASRLEHYGVFVICALIAPYAESRACVRGLCHRFVEVHVSTPLPECERRDVKGLYKRARRGEIANFTGLEAPYEPPTDPEARIDTTTLTVSEAVDEVLRALTLVGGGTETRFRRVRRAIARQ